MGEENKKLQGIFYSVNGTDGEWKELASTEIPKLAPGGVVDKKPILTGTYRGVFDFTVKLKTITKKRFIKLLMSMGHQKNKAYKMHEEYMKKHKTRTKLELYIFEAFYDERPEFELFIGGKKRNGNIKTNNM